MKRRICLLVVFVMVLSLLSGTVLAAELRRVSSPGENDSDLVSGNWGDHGTYTWDPVSKTLTIEAEATYDGSVWSLSGNDIEGYKDIVETLIIDAPQVNVSDFNGYNMKYLKFHGNDYNDSDERGDFADCVNLEEVEAYGGVLEHSFHGCDNMKKFVIAGAILLDFAGTPKTCIFYGPDNDEYRIPLEFFGYTYVIIDPENPFEDVAPNNWYHDAVLWAVSHGVTKGTSETTFSPDQSCSRAEIMTILWRAAGSPEPTITECSFVDVNPGSYYYTPVLWAVENHVTAGTGAPTFSPNDTCTRAQIVTFIWRQRGSVAEGDASQFEDLKPGAYYIPAVAWAVANGVTAGTSATTFSPEKTCNRAEAVTLIYGAYGDE